MSIGSARPDGARQIPWSARASFSRNCLPEALRSPIVINAGRTGGLVSATGAGRRFTLAGISRSSQLCWTLDWVDAAQRVHGMVLVPVRLHTQLLRLTDRCGGFHGLDNVAQPEAPRGDGLHEGSSGTSR